MYNVTLDIPEVDNGAKFMDAGIHDNVELTNVEYRKSPNSEFIAFYFKNESDEIGSHTEWIQDSANATPEQLEEKKLNQMSRIKQIARCFMTKEEFVFSANDFEDFATKAAALINAKKANVKLRVKFVYQKQTSKYTSLPNYWKFRFIERMDNNGFYGEKAKETPSVKPISFDIFKKAPEAAVTSVQNPFDTAAIANDGMTATSIDSTQSPF